MQLGVALARTGELQARSRQLAAEHAARVARAGQLKDSGRQLGTRRAERYRAMREKRAAALGFTTLKAYYQRRYVDQAARLEDYSASSAPRTPPCGRTCGGLASL